ncbi:MAG: histidine kinase [Gemmatimonadetes bacterium]|nr:histidine kinase [Gemmatimonadota bacterium]
MAMRAADAPSRVPGTPARNSDGAGADHAIAGAEPVGTPRPWRIWIIALFFWSLPALLSTRAMVDAAGGAISFWRALLIEGLPWFFWALMTPAMIAMTRRFPVDPPGIRNLAAHLGAGLSMGVATGLIWLLLSALFGPGTPVRGAQEAGTGNRFVALAFWAAYGLLFYAATVAVGFALDYHRKLRERERTAAQLQNQLVEARLNALRMQLQPHFLFNSLNTVSMLVRQGDAPTAVRVVARLSDLLRYVLDEAGGALVPLRDEVDFASRYLEIEQLRFRDRLRVRIDVEDAAADVPVPGLLLQPLVENAVRHGIAARAAAGCIALSARIDGRRLIIELQDDGPGLAVTSAADGSGGIGLRNTRARLEYAYGDAASLQLENGPAGGAKVLLTLPLQPAGSGG